jgi:hypothetical protein
MVAGSYILLGISLVSLLCRIYKQREKSGQKNCDQGNEWFREFSAYESGPDSSIVKTLAAVKER